MSLDIYLTAMRPTTVFDRNITHNLGLMAKEAGIYDALWRPDEHGIELAVQMIEPLTKGLERLKADEAHFRQFDAPNGWGRYEHLISFTEQVLAACADNPDATVGVSR